MTAARAGQTVCIIGAVATISAAWLLEQPSLLRLLATTAVLAITAAKNLVATEPEDQILNSSMSITALAASLCDPGFRRLVREDLPCLQQLQLDIWHVLFVASAAGLTIYCLDRSSRHYSLRKRLIFAYTSLAAISMVALGQAWNTEAPLLSQTDSARFSLYFWVYAVAMTVLSGCAVVIFSKATWREGNTRQRVLGIAASVIAVVGISSILWIAYGASLMTLGNASIAVEQNVITRVHGDFMVTFLAPLYATVIPSIQRDWSTRIAIRRLKPIWTDLLEAVPAARYPISEDEAAGSSARSQFHRMRSEVSDAAVSLFYRTAAQRYIDGVARPTALDEAAALNVAVLDPSRDESPVHSLTHSTMAIAKAWKPIRKYESTQI